MPVFVLTRERGPSWDYSRGLREQEAWHEHAAFMEALAEEGFVFLGGPLGDDHVMHVIVADDEEQIRGRLAADPWEPMGLLRNVSIERWQILLGSPPGDARTSDGQRAFRRPTRRLSRGPRA